MKARSVQVWTSIGALLLLVAGVTGALAAPRMLLACWLAAWWCCLGLMLGGCVNLWIHGLTGGRWGDALRPGAARLVLRRLWLWPLVVPLALGLSLLYPWAALGAEAFQTLDRPAFAQAWFSLPAFALRCLLYALLWTWMAGSAQRPLLTRQGAVLSLVGYAISGTMASVDLLMSLITGWVSTGFGLLALVAQMLGGTAALVLWTAWRLPASLSATPGNNIPVGRDLGNLMLVYVLTWGYLGFMQFLIIWSENLPKEIAWYVPRLQTGWWHIGVALVVAQLALPLALLVLRGVKEAPLALGATAALVLVAHALDCVWMVLPSVDAQALAGWWLAPLCLGGMALLLFAPMGAAASALPEGATHGRA